MTITSWINFRLTQELDTFPCHIRPLASSIFSEDSRLFGILLERNIYQSTQISVKDVVRGVCFGSVPMLKLLASYDASLTTHFVCNKRIPLSCAMQHVSVEAIQFLEQQNYFKNPPLSGPTGVRSSQQYLGSGHINSILFSTRVELLYNV